MGLTPSRPEARPPARRACLALAGLTLFAAVIRFFWLNHPCLWWDELATYARVCGSYRQLLDVLQFDGFVPLHYNLYWLIVRIRPVPGPAVMRFVPALAGTLMVPAMYFLAVQLVRRRVALFVAAATACSAFMMIYSRDAKMYMHAWLFSALSVGCFLWWLRTRRVTAWLCWIAAGVAAAGLHVTALFLVPIELVVVLTAAAFTWPRLLLFILGAAVISAGPAGYYACFNRWSEHIDQKGWNVSGLQWIGAYNSGRSGPDQVRLTGIAYLTSWEWPRPLERALIEPTALSAMLGSTALLLGLLALGCFPWPRGPRPPDPDAPQAPWRQMLWLGTWIVLPAYALYCHSTEEFAAPSAWTHALRALFHARFMAVVGYAVVMVVGLRLLRSWRIFRWLVLIAGVLATVIAIARNPPFWKFWTELALWPGILTDHGVIAAAMLVFLAAAWRCCGDSFSQRCSRTWALLAPAALIFALCWVIYAISLQTWENKVSAMLADHHNVPRWDGTVRQIEQAYHSPADSRERQFLRDAAWRQVLLENPGTVDRVDHPDRWPDALQELHRLTDQRLEQRQHRWQQLVAQGSAASAAERLAAEHLVWDLQWKSLWVPRYLGVIWPAVVIVACILLMRLPTRPLRWTGCALFLALNLAMAGARVFAGTEPPTDLIVADLLASQSADSRAYIDIPYHGGAPGSFDLLGDQVKYYLAVETGRPLEPADFYPLGQTNVLKKRGLRYSTNASPYFIAIDLRADPTVDRIVVWDARDPKAPDRSQGLVDVLGPGWKLVDRRDFHVRTHWTWMNLYTCTRRVFVKS